MVFMDFLSHLSGDEVPVVRTNSLRIFLSHLSGDEGELLLLYKSH